VAESAAACQPSFFFSPIKHGESFSIKLGTGALSAFCREMAATTRCVTRGAVEDMVLTSVAPQAAQIKRYEDNNTTLSA
jgi:hypothetical protein